MVMVMVEERALEVYSMMCSTSVCEREGGSECVCECVYTDRYESFLQSL
jgi:hypothetical protein